jgi:hypothetical protein
MERTLFLAFITFIVLSFPEVYCFAEEGRYQVVIEESYYKVRPEHQDEFLELYKKKIFPFWKEIEKMGLIDGEIKMYTQRIHFISPSINPIPLSHLGHLKPLSGLRTIPQ